MQTTLIYLLTSLSLFLNIFLIYKLKSNPKTQKKESIELQEFLADLLSGGSMLAVRRVDPESFLLRSPKQR